MDNDPDLLGLHSSQLLRGVSICPNIILKSSSERFSLGDSVMLTKIFGLSQSELKHAAGVNKVMSNLYFLSFEQYPCSL